MNNNFNLMYEKILTENSSSDLNLIWGFFSDIGDQNDFKDLQSELMNLPERDRKKFYSHIKELAKIINKTGI